MKQMLYELYVIITLTKRPQKGDDMMRSYYDVTSVPDCVIFKTIRFLRLSMKISILIAVFVCLAHILHIFLC